MKRIIAISKKQKNNRSVMLSALMKGLGGDTGNTIADAFSGTDPEKFREAMGKVVEDLVKKMPNAG